jgi:Tol biopolymer transport system component
VKRLLLLGALLVFAVPASASTARIVAPQDLWPVFSPDGAHVAFTRVYQNHMQLLTVALRSGRVASIGSNAGQLAPSWSSDGLRLAYSSGGVLYTARADGSAKTRYLAPLRAFAPAWRPASDQLAYLTTHGATNTDLWVAGTRWATDAIGAPAWSPDGTTLAFQRDDGIYATGGADSERRLVSVANPGPPAFSHDGARVAYVAGGTLYAVPVAGGPAQAVARNQPAGIRPSWSPGDSTVRVGGSFAPGTGYVAPAPRPSCPGHVVLRIGTRTLTGSCLVTGTPKADVIEGTRLWGDVILAGAGNDKVHANDGHTDRVNCGPGRDTVWADRTDKLAGCEIVHR